MLNLPTRSVSSRPSILARFNPPSSPNSTLPELSLSPSKMEISTCDFACTPISNNATMRKVFFILLGVRVEKLVLSRNEILITNQTDIEPRQNNDYVNLKSHIHHEPSNAC